MINLRLIFQIIGILLMPIGLGMLASAALDYALGHPDWQIFVASSSFTLFVGLSLFLSTHGGEQTLNIKQAFLLTVLAWTVVPAFSALPFVFSGVALSFVDAYFEAMSGLTTTGSTVLTGLDAAPPGILLWRSLLQWLGGVGIIVMAIAILPILRIGGMQLFRTESSDPTDKILPRISLIVWAILSVYGSLTLLCFTAYAAAGMSVFDAVTHSMSTISTAGFSTHDKSFLYFNNPIIDFVASFFMILGALPFLLYIQLLRGGSLQLWSDDQVKFFLGIVFSAVTAMTVWLSQVENLDFFSSLRYGVFSVISVVTTTGFVTEPFDAWGPFASIVFLILMLLGGCAGSSSGGLKAYRVKILCSALINNLKRLSQPHAVYRPVFNAMPVQDPVIAAVMNFVIFYIFGAVAVSVALALTGLDLVTAVSGALTTLGNVGPGLGPVIGPASTFQSLPDTAKWICSFSMMAGRLELLTVLTVLTPAFWRE